jgi:hypothetical protein
LLAIVESLRGLGRRIEIVEKQIVGWGRDNRKRSVKGPS